MALQVTSPVALLDLFTGSVKRDGGDELLERFLGGMQAWFDSATQRRVDLLQALDPFDMEEIQGDDGRTTLDYALWLVGLTDELDWLVRQLTSDQKRRLLRSACALWKLKGLPEGWLRWVALLTGKPALYVDYFGWRYLTDEDFIGDGPVLLDPLEDPVFGAYQSDLYVVDPGTTLRELIRHLVDISRAASERVRLRWVDGLEVWDRGFLQWARVEGTGTIIVDEADRSCLVPAGGGPLADNRLIWRSGTFASGYGHYLFRVTFAMSSVAAGRAEFIYHYQGTDTYEYVAVDAAGGNVLLYSRIAGLDGLHVAWPLPWAMAADVDYHLEVLIEFGPVVDQIVVAVRLDGEPIGEIAYVTAALAGPFGIRNTLPGMDLTVRTVMAFTPPLDYDYAAPDGAYDDEA
ncbi:MAG: hypothetical protein ABIL09_16670 [Gemmatimonadota bacterium]